MGLVWAEGRVKRAVEGEVQRENKQRELRRGERRIREARVGTEPVESERRGMYDVVVVGAWKRFVGEKWLGSFEYAREDWVDKVRDRQRAQRVWEVRPPTQTRPHQTKSASVTVTKPRMTAS